MKKSRKLLSVLLAMIMILSSMTMLASAAPANYKTVNDLNGMNAYSKYGAATRLSTEERTSMVLDALDNILEAANINLGQVFNALGLSLTIDLRSINALCETVDQVKTLKGSAAVTMFGGLLGIVKDLNTDSWEADVDRTNDDQIRILYELTQLLYENRQLVSDVIESGKLDVGVIGNFVDLSAVSGYLADIPGLIKGLIIPLLIRADDTAATLSDYKNKASGAGKLEDILDNFVQGIFKKPMNWTSYRENAAGTPCDENGNTAHGATVALPTEPEATANYYVKGTNANGDKIITRYKYNLEFGSWAEDGTFVRTEEKAGSGVYIYADPNGGENLKYYTYGEDGYFLPNAKTLSFSIKGNDSAAGLLYKFASPVFSAMAPVVLNGSLKKILGQWFGAQYNFVGNVGSAEVQALPDSSDVFFTQEQGQYLWEWSDYKVINGNHYYRFEDQIFAADLTNINPYFEIINWDYKIEGNFLDEFIPSINGTTVTNSKAGYSTILQGLNKFLIKVADTVLASDIRSKMTLTSGDNSNLVANIKNIAQTVVKHSPESIFGADYATGYYDLMTNAASSNQDVLNGIAATIIDLVMPQMIIPSAENLKGNSVGAILAAVLRELATQLITNHNYDALIYNNYNNKTFVAGKDNSYWLDVILTIGTDIGVHYLMNLADMGEGTAQWAGMTKAGWAESKAYTAADLNEINGVKPWEAKVDYIVDWALDNSYEWCWGMENLVNVEGLTIDPATVQDPWVKLDKILNDLLPLKQIINCTPASGMTWLETVLRQNFILAIADLRIKDLTDLLIVPNGALRNTDVLLQIATIVKNLLNTLLYKVGSYTLLDSVSKVNRIDDLLNQTNLATVVRNLLGMIWPAINKDYSIANGAKAGTAGTFARDGLLTTALPIVNMFLGWTTDAQKMQNPTLLFNNAEGLSYMYTTGTTVSSTLKIRNDSAGMLLKHRTSSVTDKAYNIVVQKIECSDSSFSTTATFPMTIAPYTKGEVPITLNYAGDKAVSIKITYVFMGKDGKQVGQTQTATAYQYVSNQKTDAGGSTGDKSDAVKGGVANTKNALGVDVTGTTAVMVYDSFDAVPGVINNYTVNFRNTTESPYVIWVSRASGRGQPAWVTFNNDFSHSSRPSVSCEGYITKDPETGTIKPFLVDESKIPASMKTGPQAIDLGQWTVNWHNTLKAPLIGSWNENTGNNNLEFTLDAGDIYVTDTALLKSTYNNYKSLNRIGFPGVSDATWNAFQTAILNAAAIVERPFKIADVTGGVYARDKQDALIKALNDTYNAVVAGATGVENPTAALEEALATVEPGGDVPEINYQDYVLYEYFEYQDERTATRNRIREYQAPQAPAAKRIEGSALTADEINAIVAAEKNVQKANAINATVLTPTEKELADYQTARAAWKAPGYTRLDNYDQASKLVFYKQFLEKVTTQKQFLEKEIEAANAQTYEEAKYSKASWAAYKAAYDNAVAVNNKADALQSEVFNAKYDLMRTQNELVLATRSAKETGAYNTLAELAKTAEAIFARSEYYAPVEGMTEADAYAALIKALGYKYTDAAGNEAILYSRSAYDYMAYDRETTSNNMAKIAAAEEALKAAINNFVCTIQLEAKPGDTTTVVAQGPRIIDGITPGTITSVDDLLTHVQATVPEATLETTVSKANAFGTGAKVDVKLDGTTMTTYYVVIYGDVNGDGAIDGFDAVELDLANSGSANIDGAYATAADTDGNGVVDSVDYASVIAEVQCTSAIAQTK